MYGGTKTEMLRLVNDSKIFDKQIKDLDEVSFADMIKAINAVQNQLGVTGTTAKEAADTIEGSAGTMKAAWQNALTQMVSTDNVEFEKALAEFETSFQTYVDNIAPRVVKAIGGSGSLIKTIIDAVTDTGDSEGLVTEGVENLVGTTTDIVDSAGDLVDWLLSNMTAVFSDRTLTGQYSQDLGESLGNFIGESLKNIALSLPSLVSGLFESAKSLATGLVKGLFAGIFEDASPEQEITEDMMDALVQADQDAIRANSLIGIMGNLLDKYGQGATQMAEWKEAVNQLDEVVPGAKNLVEEYSQTFDDLSTSIMGAIAQQIAFKQGKIEPAIETMIASLNKAGKSSGSVNWAEVLGADDYKAQKSIIEQYLPESKALFQQFEQIAKSGNRKKINQGVLDLEKGLKELDENTFTAQTEEVQTALNSMAQLEQEYGTEAYNMAQWSEHLNTVKSNLSSCGAQIDDYVENHITPLTTALSNASDAQHDLAFETAKQIALGKLNEQHQQTYGQLLETSTEKQIKDNDLSSYKEQMLEIIRGVQDEFIEGSVSDSIVKGALREGATSREIASALLELEQMNAFRGAWGKSTLTEDQQAILGEVGELIDEYDSLTTKEEELQAAYEKETEHITQFEKALDDVTTSYSRAAEASRQLASSASNAARNLGGYNVPTAGGKTFDMPDGEHATGLDRVPYDGYIARLHRNETVLTKAEADSYWRSRRGASAPQIDYDRLADVMTRAMTHMNVGLNPDYIGRNTAGIVSREIAYAVR